MTTVNIVVSERSTPDGFTIGDRVAYLQEGVFRLAQGKPDGSTPPNDFLVRSVATREGRCSVFLIDADGNPAGREETLNLRKLDGKFRVFSVLDDALEARAFDLTDGPGCLDVVQVHDYVRANHGEHDRLSLARYDDAQLYRLIAVWVAAKREST